MDAAVQVAAPNDVEELAVCLRWPDGVVICPHCGESRVSQQPAGNRRCWRCKQCRRRFTVTSGTRLHASKLSLADWWTASHLEDDGTAAVMRLLGTSQATAGRVSRLLRATGTPAGKRRFAALLSDGEAPPTEQPWNEWSEAQRRVFAAVRSHHLKGGLTAQIANTANVSPSHTRRCLRALASSDFVNCDEQVSTWGYDCISFKIWQLSFTPQTTAAMMHLPYQPLLPLQAPPTRVPPEFWWVFWSGFCASRLRLPEDGLLVAETMLSVPDQWARLWALQYAPLDALRELRTMRGYTTGEVAQDLELAIEQRSHA